MKKILLAVAILFLINQAVFAQVDVERRRTVILQTELGAYHSDEELNAFGYYWYNQNNFPWTNSALRVIFAGIFVDSELSIFLPSSTNTAVGIGGGGGLLLDSVTPYNMGKYVAKTSFYGDAVNIRGFINQTIPNPSPIPINVRATYGVAGSFYRKTSDTKNFDLPDDMLVQFVGAELRVGGIEPGLTSVRGAELYLSADVNYRTGFDGFGPVAANYPQHSEYERLFGSLGGKIPIGPTVLFPRIAGGLGENLDQISAWKIGGNLVGVEPYAYMLHGYYTRELFASDFALGNLAWTFPICHKYGITGNLYADWALIKLTPPSSRDWDNYFGFGAAVGFRGPWQVNTLVGYGYGVNAVRRGDRGGHEISLALEKNF